MKLNTIARRIVHELSALWSPHKSSARQGNPEVPPTQGPGGKPTNDQRAAVNRWEGEGGSTAATKPSER